MRTRADIRASKARNVQKQRLAAYRLAEFRDGGRCRACGRRTLKILTIHPRRLEHHHIAGRSVEHAEDTRNIVCLCRECHEDRHVRRTLHISGNADTSLRFERDGRIWFG